MSNIFKQKFQGHYYVAGTVRRVVAIVYVEAGINPDLKIAVSVLKKAQETENTPYYGAGYEIEKEGGPEIIDTKALQAIPGIADYIFAK